MASSSLGCLVTSTPSYQPPEQTAPLLLANGWATPSFMSNITIHMNESKDFSTSIVSEDGGVPVHLISYVDYGNPLQKLDDQAGVSSSLPAGTLADGPRPMTSPLSLSSGRLSAFGAVGNCHTFTMIATHEFQNSTQCPVCQTDSSTLNWVVQYCPDSSQCPAAENCSAILNPMGWTNICHDDPSAKCEFPTNTPSDAGVDASTGATP